jgi:hypothetical protein
MCQTAARKFVNRIAHIRTVHIHFHFLSIVHIPAQKYNAPITTVSPAIESHLRRTRSVSLSTAGTVCSGSAGDWPTFHSTVCPLAALECLIRSDGSIIVVISTMYFQAPRVKYLCVTVGQFIRQPLPLVLALSTCHYEFFLGVSCA